MISISRKQTCNYKILSSVSKLVLVLSHGQAAVERGLSVNNKVLNVNMHEISITSRKLIIDHMNSHSLLPQSFPITKSLLKSVRCSRQGYLEFLRERILTETKRTVHSVSHHRQGNWGSERLSRWIFETFRWSWKEEKLRIVVKGKCIEKKIPRKTGWSQQTWRGFAGTPREKKKDYVMGS